MKKIFAFFLMLVCVSAGASAQNFSAAPHSWSSNIFQRPVAPAQLPGPARLDDFVVNGKLRLGVEDALLLALLNNSDISVNRATFDISWFALQRARQPFDPLLTAGFNPTRAVSPSTSSLNGASTLSQLTQTSTLDFSQQFQTGTLVGVGFNTTRFSTNSSFETVNPSFTSGLSFSVAQPLWRKAGLFANRAPILIARRGVKQARATLESQMNNTVALVIDQYWDVVQAVKSLEVQRQSLERAEASYQHDKRALELGALSPLDIYRSESKVAQRKIAVVQAEYSLKKVQDTLRQTMGANLDRRIATLDIDLTDSAEARGDLPSANPEEALAEAEKNRPDLEAQRQQLAIDDVSIRLAANNLRPDINLGASYASNGVGGIVFDRNGNPVSIGGFSDSLGQLGGFTFPTYSLNLQVRFPLRNSAAAADLGTAIVAKKRGLYQMRSQEQTVGTEVKNAVHDLEQAEILLGASKASLDVATKSLAAEERKYQLGAQTIFFVLDAQDTLSQAEQALLQSQIAYQKALTELDRATGKLLAKHSVTVR